MVKKIFSLQAPGAEASEVEKRVEEATVTLPGAMEWMVMSEVRTEAAAATVVTKLERKAESKAGSEKAAMERSEIPT